MRALLDLVLPLECAGCGCRGAVACRSGLLELAGDARLAWPRPSPPGLPPPWAVAPYGGHVREFLLAYKEHGAVGLRRPLGVALASSLRAALPAARQPVVVVPVPSSRAARRRRGSDVINDVAMTAVATLRAEGRQLHVVRGLRHARSVADSAGLTATERSTNLAGAFEVRAPRTRHLRGRVVVVVDDLITTGVTLTECAAALAAAGASVEAVATIAATRRQFIS